IVKVTYLKYGVNLTVRAALDGISIKKKTITWISYQVLVICKQLVEMTGDINNIKLSLRGEHYNFNR
ncbi:hypothetical protein ACLBO7_29830, partial [Klebsiella pneumoniae]